MQEKLEQLEKKYSVDWREYRIGDLFEIKNTFSFNKDKLIPGNEYDYVTRTSQNQGILQKTGFVNLENINPAGVWSLGLLQMDFFYRQKPWYAGQFVKKVLPKIELSKRTVQYFTVLLNKQKASLLSGLVRDVDETFKEAIVTLPTVNNEIAFDYIEEFVNTLEAERLATLEAYLLATGLKNTELTPEERSALDKLGGAGSVKWRDFRNDELFDVSPSKSYSGFNDDKILVKNGKTPYVSNQSQDNGYIGWSNLEPLNEENVITLSDTWQSERTIFYQPKAFIGKSHLQVMSPLMEEFDVYSAMFIISSFRKSILKINYDYGTKFNRAKIKATKIQLPVKEDGTLDFEFMTTLIKAMQKVVIKNVVTHLDKRIALTDKVIKEFR